MSLITADDLAKTYRTEAIEVKALQGLSFAIEPGAFLAFVGPSGSGKTTLLNLVGCLDKPSGGSLQVAGVDVLKLGRRQAAEFRGQNIGLIFQSFNLLAVLTAFENVEYLQPESFESYRKLINIEPSGAMREFLLGLYARRTTIFALYRRRRLLYGLR